MKKVRIGNDIAIEWSIYRLGEGEILQDKKVEVKILDPKMMPIPFSYEIVENKIIGVFEGRIQKCVGAYTLLLLENCGELHMNTLDECNFVQLVPHSYMESGKDESSITTEKIELSTDIEVPTNGLDGDSAYDIWIKLGYTGSEEDFIAWLQQPAINAANEAQEQMALFAEKEAVRDDAELERVANEETRKANEQERIRVENTRENAEAIRKENDMVMQEHETERMKAEDQRVLAEQKRNINEDARKSQEATRISNENQRIKNESKRKSVVRTSKLKTEGLVDTYIIVYSDGSFDTFTVTNGKDGSSGYAYSKSETDALLAGKASATSLVQMEYEEEPVEVDTNLAISLMSTGINNHIHDTDEALHRLDGDKADKTEVYTKAETNELLDNKADKDGFKTINGESIVGGGDITIEGGGVDVVQTTGQSTTAVMSQKAVTDALAGAGGDWEFIAELNITEPVAYFEQDLGKVYNECMILGIDFKMEAITSGASGYSVNLSINRSNDNRLQLENGSAYRRGFYAHYFNDKDTSRRYVIQTTQITSNTTLKISGGNFPSWASKRTLDKICIEAMSAGMGFTGNFKIYAK